MKKNVLFLLLAVFAITGFTGCKEDLNYKALIISGQNNHNWKVSYPVLKQLLDQTGIFTTDTIITPGRREDISTFNPDFSKYDVIVLDYNGKSWSDEVKGKFVSFIEKGGGLVIYHAADNSFPEWKEYNEMIGLGGWGNRSAKDGPYVYYKDNQLVIDTTQGIGGSHGKQHEFMVKLRNDEHPVTKGMPARWMHGTDELYSQLRGPAKNMEILATAYADSTKGGSAATNRDEPVLMTIKYGNGRIFHTVLGHAGTGEINPAMECVGFIATFQRGTEWAASGKVTQDLPYDFPSPADVVLRPDFREITLADDIEAIKKYELTKSNKYFYDLQARIRRSAGKGEKLREYEDLMIKILTDKDATNEGKKLILKELSWMGTSRSLKPVRGLCEIPELKDEAIYTLQRIKGNYY